MRNLQKLFLAISAASVLSTVAAPTSAQATEQASRDKIRSAVRSKLHLKADQFLAVQRDEPLEQKLAIVAGKPGLLLYRISQAGDEIKEHSLVHHIFTDADPTYIVAVSADGGMYRIHGFSDSGAEFEKLMTATGLKVSSREDAESVADFYRDVNPENRPLTPISNLIDLKQAAERQCQTGTFNENERAFDAWWSRAKPLYAGVPFQQKAIESGKGYLVEWVVLSSAAPGMCGGAALRARLEVLSDGHVGTVAFSPLEPRRGRR
jgi:hypothetical protein